LHFDPAPLSIAKARQYKVLVEVNDLHRETPSFRVCKQLS
jgi:hypothetical protein